MRTFIARTNSGKTFIGGVFETVSCEQLLCFLESFVPFRIYRFIEFEVFIARTNSVAKTFIGGVF